MSTHGGTEEKFTAAQERIIGKFCSHCRQHRPVEGGRSVRVGTKRQVRWFCAACGATYDKVMERAKCSSRKKNSAT